MALEPYLNPIGASQITHKYVDLKQNAVSLHDEVDSRSHALEDEVTSRRQFYEEWEQLEEWLKRMQSRLDNTSQIYSDQVKDTADSLEVRNDCVYCEAMNHLQDIHCLIRFEFCSFK